MAKIKQVKMRLELDLDRLWKETVVNICYDSTDKNTAQSNRPVPEERFYIVLPQIVADALGYERVRAKDQGVVMGRFEEALEKYKRLKVEVNQVIVYSFEVEPKPGAEVKPWDYGYKVRISVGRFNETVMIAGDGGKRYSYAWVESEIEIGGKDRHLSCSGGAREDKQVPWNDKNAAFFLWIKKNMELLIKGLYELEEPVKLLETIHAGRLLPLGDRAEQVGK